MKLIDVTAAYLEILHVIW